MTKITITCQGSAARAEVEGALTAGAVGVPVELRFDDVWNGLSRRMKARTGDTVRSVLLTENTAVVPWECLIAGMTLEIGVEGWSVDGTLKLPTVWASCGVVLPSAAEADGEAAEPAPSPTLAQQIQQVAESVRRDADNGCFNGRDGMPPRIDPQTNTWLVWENDAYTDSGVPVNVKGDPGGTTPEAIRTAVSGYLEAHPVTANVELASPLRYRHSAGTQSPQRVRCVNGGLFSPPSKILLGRNYFPEVKEWLRGETYKGVTFHSSDGGTIRISGTPTAGDTANSLLFTTDNLDFAYEELHAGDAMQLEVYSAVDQPGGTQIQVAVTAKGSSNVVSKINLGYNSTTAAGVQRANLTLPAGFTALNFQIVAKNSGKSYDNTLLIVLRRTADSVLDGVDGGEVTLPSFAPEVATYPNPSVMTSQVNPKEYTDAKFAQLSGGAAPDWLTPETFGARGDNTGDDTDALNACLTAAASTRQPVRGFGRYRCEGTVVIGGVNVDVELNQLNCVDTTVAAVQLNTLQNSRVRILKLAANTAGAGMETVGVKRCHVEVIQLENAGGVGFCADDGDAPTTRNSFTFHRISAKQEAILGRSIGANYYNTFRTDDLRSEESDLIRNFSECAFYGYACQAANGFVAADCQGCKFYHFSLEHTVCGGFRNLIRCMVYGSRTVELADYNAKGEHNAPLIRLEGRNSGNTFWFCGPVPIENIDVSGMFDREALLESLQTDPSSETIGYSANRNVIYGNIQNCAYYWYADHKNTAQPCGNNSDLGEQCILRLGRKIVVPRRQVAFRVEIAQLDLRDSTFPFLPTVFTIGTPTTIFLSDSYCSVGASELRIDQSAHKAVVKNSQGEVIFDGNSQSYGVYTLRFLANPEPYKGSVWENLLRDTVEIVKNQ